MDVANNISSVTLTPTRTRAGQAITVAGTTVASGTASGAITLVAGTPKAIAVVVTASDGTTTGTYTVTVTRALGPPVVKFTAATMTVTETNASQVIMAGITIGNGAEIQHENRIQNQRRNRNRRKRLHSRQ